MSNVFDEVLTHFESISAMATALGERSRQTVHNWRGRGIPVHKCKQVSALTGIPLDRLRPDDWHRYWSSPKPVRVRKSTRPAA